MKKIKELKYFEISDVQLRNIELPQQIQTKIMQVQAAKQEAEARIRQARDRAESIKLEAEAQAEANRKLSESLTKELIEYQKIQKWNGNLSQYVGDSNGMILQMK